MKAMEMPITSGWNSPCSPPQFEGGSFSSFQHKARPLKKYEVEPRSFTLFISASKAKKAHWPTHEVRPDIKTQPAQELPPENIAAIQLLQSWRNEDSQEQRETWEFLKQAIDEDRLSDRKFFP
jgi:hypothetical protein